MEVSCLAGDGSAGCVTIRLNEGQFHNFQFFAVAWSVAENFFDYQLRIHSEYRLFLHKWTGFDNSAFTKARRGERIRRSRGRVKPWAVIHGLSEAETRVGETRRLYPTAPCSDAEVKTTERS